MKLVIQIPAWDEEEHLATAIAALPRKIDGVDRVEVLVIDDGSSDRTSEVARQAGADRVVRLPFHRGLAAAFSTGLRTSLEMEADIVVNTDADNQYEAADIPRLIEPILRGEAAVVVGDRRVETVPHFPTWKILLQKLGSAVVSYASGLQVPDATSGFRAFSREALLRLNVFTRMTYTLETLIQAGELGLPVATLPIRTNPKSRDSRLIRSTTRYVITSATNILRITALYRPLKLFLTLAALAALPGLALVARWLWYFLVTEGATGKTQSLLIGSSLLLVAGGCAALGVVADLVSVNRRLLEELQLEQRRTLRNAERRSD